MFFLWCFKVYLGQDGQVEVYENMTIQPNSPIKRDLLLDQSGAHIYIMTKTTVSIKCVIQQITLHKGAFQVS